MVCCLRREFDAKSENAVLSSTGSSEGRKRSKGRSVDSNLRIKLHSERSTKVQVVISVGTNSGVVIGVPEEGSTDGRISESDGNLNLSSNTAIAVRAELLEVRGNNADGNSLISALTNSAESELALTSGVCKGGSVAIEKRRTSLELDGATNLDLLATEGTGELSLPGRGQVVERKFRLHTKSKSVIGVVERGVDDNRGLGLGILGLAGDLGLNTKFATSNELVSDGGSDDGGRVFGGE
jgi:hypothetical protein